MITSLVAVAVALALAIAFGAAATTNTPAGGAPISGSVSPNDIGSGGPPGL